MDVFRREYVRTLVIVQNKLRGSPKESLKNPRSSAEEIKRETRRISKSNTKGLSK